MKKNRQRRAGDFNAGGVLDQITTKSAALRLAGVVPVE